MFAQKESQPPDLTW